MMSPVEQCAWTTVLLRAIQEAKLNSKKKETTVLSQSAVVSWTQGSTSIASAIRLS